MTTMTHAAMPLPTDVDGIAGPCPPWCNASRCSDVHLSHAEFMPLVGADWVEVEGVALFPCVGLMLMADTDSTTLALSLTLPPPLELRRLTSNTVVGVETDLTPAAAGQLADLLASGDGIHPPASRRRDRRHVYDIPSVGQGLQVVADSSSNLYLTLGAATVRLSDEDRRTLALILRRLIDTAAGR